MRREEGKSKQKKQKGERKKKGRKGEEGGKNNCMVQCESYFNSLRNLIKYTVYPIRHEFTALFCTVNLRLTNEVYSRIVFHNLFSFKHFIHLKKVITRSTSNNFYNL